MNSVNEHPMAVADSARSHKTLIHTRQSLIYALVFLALAGSGRALFNHHQALALETATQERIQRTVIVTQAREGELKRTVTLPATLRGNSDTLIYARSTGYVKAWYKTLGDKVKKGDLLALIEAPEQDQELAQARATREQVSARLAVTRTTAERWESLRKLDGVSQQELEEKRAALAQTQADIAAADANVNRLEQLQGFRRITAPFAGVITRRNAEIGQLINSNSREMFALSQTDPLRLTIWVPQNYANDVKAGKEVNVLLNEYPGKRFAATIDHAAGGIDPLNRSRQVDLTLPNPDGKLLPGAYAEVSIALVSGTRALVVPASVLMIGAEGPRVASVDAENHIVIKPVRLGRDLGREVEILSGIDKDAQLVVSPSDLLVEGETVKSQALLTKTAKDTKDEKVRPASDAAAGRKSS